MLVRALPATFVVGLQLLASAIPHANGDCPASQSPYYTGTLIAEAGQPAPGTTGNFQLLNATPAVNEAQHVAFWTETTSDEEVIYVWQDGDLEPLAVTLTPAPGGGGIFLEFGKKPSINSASHVAFGAVRSAASPALYLAADGAVDLLVYSGQRLPGTGSNLTFGGGNNPHLNDDGSIYFGATLLNYPEPGMQAGAFLRYQDETIVPMIVTGTDASGLGTITSMQYLTISESGSFALLMDIDDKESIVHFANDVFSLVATVNKPAPGTGGLFETFLEAPQALGHVEVVFLARIGNLDEDIHVLYRSTSTGELDPIAIEGGPGPLPGTTFTSLSAPKVTSTGDILFHAAHDGPLPQVGVFRYDMRTGCISPVLVEGDPAPGAPDGIVEAFSAPLATNAAGDWSSSYRTTDDVGRLIFMDRRVFADFTLDGVVDLDDYAFFFPCFQGPGAPILPGCEAADLNGDGVVDLCDFRGLQNAFVPCLLDTVDCNLNGVPDACELESSDDTDCDENGVLDACDVLFDGLPDCNGNLLPDACDIASGMSFDFDENGVPDECQGFSDCNHNGIGDLFEILDGTAIDCNLDKVPDDCQLFSGDPFLIGPYTDGNLLRANLAGTPFPVVVHSDIPTPSRGMAPDCQGGVWVLGLWGEIAHLDTRTLAVEVVATAAVTWNAAAYDCANDVIYATTFGDSSPEFGLYRIDSDDGAVEFVGNLFIAISGLTFDSTNGILYGMGPARTLWLIGQEDASRTIICPGFPAGQVNGLAFNDGFVYTWSSGDILQIDPTSCEMIVLGATPPINFAFGLAYVSETTDCNFNDVPDDCDIESGKSLDLDENGRPDECEAEDCNANGIFDGDELAGYVSFQAGPLSPIGTGVEPSFLIPDMPPTQLNVLLTVDVSADLHSAGSTIKVRINDIASTGSMFQSANDCPARPDTQPALIDDAQFQRALLAGGGGALVTVQSSNGVDPFACEPEESYANVLFEYAAEFDCNGNYVLDECEIANGAAADCNDNNLLDECDLATNLSMDCNANAIPDECDLADGTSLDCNQNLTPDECEEDCNTNTIPDDCDLANGTSEDCNANGIPDECDIASGYSTDVNGDGVPDECDPTAPVLYWNHTNPHGTIERSTLDGGGRFEIYDDTSPRDVVIDPRTMLVYWTDSGEIMRAELDGSNVEVLINSAGNNMLGIALDMINDRILWTRTGEIAMVNLDGTESGPLLSDLPAKRLVVDHLDEKLYWREGAGCIRRANLDGSSIEDIIDAEVVGNFGEFLAIDPANDWLYWSKSGGEGGIWRSRRDGSEIEQVLGGVSVTGIALDYNNQRIFFGNKIEDKIQRVDLDGNKLEDVITTELYGPGAVRIVIPELPVP